MKVEKNFNIGDVCFFKGSDNNDSHIAQSKVIGFTAQYDSALNCMKATKYNIISKDNNYFGISIPAENMYYSLEDFLLDNKAEIDKSEEYPLNNGDKIYCIHDCKIHYYTIIEISLLSVKLNENTEYYIKVKDESNGKITNFSVFGKNSKRGYGEYFKTLEEALEYSRKKVVKYC